MEEHKGVRTFYASSRAGWRKWLSENWDKEKSVFLIFYKKDSLNTSLTYDEAVDEALCYGWIDSKINKRDDESWYQYFAKRNPKSNWSLINKNKIEKLTMAGLMAPPGLEMVKVARQTGTWTALDDVENLVIPDEMKILMDANKVAFSHWEKFPKSVKKGILEWIYTAKKVETKMDRIIKTVSMASENKRANFDN